MRKDEPGVKATKHQFLKTVGSELLAWSVPRLWDLARDIPVETVPVKQFEPFLATSSCRFWSGEQPSGLEIASYVGRIMEADLAYPIILTAEDDVMDGFHRILKAWAVGLDEIRAV